MHKTLLMLIIEDEIKMSISAYLRSKAKLGWSQRRIAEDLGISQATAGGWMRLMGYGRFQAAERAWEHNLIPEALMDRPKERRAQIRRIQ